MIRDPLHAVRPEPPLRAREELAAAAPVPTGSEEPAVEQPADRPLVRRTAHVPDLAILGAGYANQQLRQRGFDVASDTLPGLLTRINVNGAGVVARSRGASRLQIASLGRASALQDPALVARLRVIDRGRQIQGQRPETLEVEVSPPPTARAGPQSSPASAAAVGAEAGLPPAAGAEGGTGPAPAPAGAETSLSPAPAPPNLQGAAPQRSAAPLAAADGSSSASASGPVLAPPGSLVDVFG